MTSKASFPRHRKNDGERWGCGGWTPLPRRRDTVDASRIVDLRSLFRHAKENGQIFREPTLCIRVPRQTGGVLQALVRRTSTRQSPQPAPRTSGSSSPLVPFTRHGRK